MPSGRGRAGTTAIESTLRVIMRPRSLPPSAQHAELQAADTSTWLINRYRRRQTNAFRLLFVSSFAASFYNMRPPGQSR